METEKAPALSASGLRLPGGFLANAGQYPRDVAFVAQGSNSRVSVAADGEVVFELPLPSAAGAPQRRWVLRERLQGSGSATGSAPLSGTVLTHMQAQHVARLASYNQVDVATRHAGIALSLQRNSGSVEKILRLAPGTAPAQAVFELSGNEDLQVAGDGRLEVRSGGESAFFSTPVAWQYIAGRRIPVEVAYQRLDAHRYGFRVGRYDRAHALTIDPVLQASYLGGVGEEDVTSLALADDGTVFVAGRTCSNPFPGTTTGVQNVLQGSCDAFIAKLSADLSQVQAATYLGGAGDERIDSLVLTPSARVSVVGWTNSVQFPGTATLNVSSHQALFVASLEPSLAVISAAQLLVPSAAQNSARASLINGANNDFYLATTLRGTPLPATQSFLGEGSGGTRNGWLAHLPADLQQPTAAVYYGGDGEDHAYDLALANGGVILAGITESSVLPGIGASSAQSARQGYDDTFIARFPLDLSALQNASYFGGEDSESESFPRLIAGVAADIYLAGATRSNNLPAVTTATNAGFTDAFVARLSSDLTTVHRSLLLGGSDYEWASALTLSPTLGLYVAGRVESSAFPATANGAQAVRFGRNNAFVSRIALDLSTVEQSTFIGGSSDASTPRAAAVSASALVIAGITQAADLPDVTGAAQPARAGTATDGFLLRLSPDLAALPNQPPLAVADSYTADENTPLQIAAAQGVLVNDSDPEGHPLSARVAVNAQHGMVFLSYDGSFRYAPQPGYDGADQFSYEVWDGSLISAPAVVSLTVNGVNDAPLAYENYVTVAAGRDSVIALDGSDPEAQPLLANINDQPQHGTLQRVDSLSFRYTPADGFDGEDQFSFRTFDGALSSEPATVHLRVYRAPDARDDAYTGLVDSMLVIPREIGLKANDLIAYPDVGFNKLRLELLEAPAIGTLQLDYDNNFPSYEGNTGGFRYTAPAGFTGLVTFRYRVVEAATGLEDTATVSLAIAASNGAPLANNDSYTLNEDENLTVDAAQGLLANDSDPEGSVLRVTAVEPVDAANDGGSIYFQPDGSFVLYPRQDAFGHFEYRYTVKDLIGSESTAIVAFDIAGIDDLPNCRQDCYIVERGQVLNVAAERGVLANDVEPDGQPLSAEVVTQPQHGTLQFSTDGSFVFTPAVAAGQRCVQDGFEYRATDGTRFSESVSVTLYICEPVVAVSDTYGVAVDTLLEITDPAAGLLANDLQLDFDNEFPDYYVIIEEDPQHGIVQLQGDGTFVYEPNAGYSGSDSFRYRLVAQRGEQCGAFRHKRSGADTGFSRTALVVLNIGQDNTAPQVQADTYSLAEDDLLDIAAPGVLANDSDANGDSLSVTGFVGTPGGGTLSISPQGAVHFVPPADASGEFIYTYTVRDAQGASTDGQVRFVVSAVNDAPRALADSYALPPGNVLNVAAAQGVLRNDSDVEGQALSATLAAQAQHGNVVLATDGSFSYTAAASFDEVDSFSYTAGDGEASSPAVSVQIRDRKPVAAADTYTVGSARQLQVSAAAGVLANDQDPEGRALTANLTRFVPSQHSIVFNADGSFTYRSPEGFQGSVPLTYAVSDGRHTVGDVAFVINVVSTIQAVADDYQATEDQVLSVDAAHGLLANDTQIDGLPLTAQRWNPPASGQVVVNADGSFVYTPNPNFNGSDSFSYMARQGADQREALVTVHVGAVADVPVAVDDTFQGDPGSGISGNLLINDSNPDGAALTPIRVSEPAHGTLTLSPNGNFVYNPAPGFSGSDGFVYRLAMAGGGFSNDAQVRLRINTRPLAQNETYMLDEDQELSVDAAHGLLANDSDAEGDALSVTFIDDECSSSDCNLLFDMQPDGSFLARARNNFNGWYEVRYRVDDGAGFSFATLRLVINPVNDAPVPANDSYIADADTTLNVNDEFSWQGKPNLLSNDIDVDRDTLTAAVVRQPDRGSLLLNPDGRFSYVPERGFLGQVSFSYAVSDGVAPPVEANVDIHVTLPPIARPDNFRLDGGTQLVVIKEQGLLINDSDEPEYDELYAELVTAADVGTVTLQRDGSFSYQAPSGYRGPAIFRYRVTDGSSFSLPATVSIRVGPSTVPFATNDVYTIGEDEPLAITAPGVLLNDDDDGGVQGLTAVGYCPWDPFQGPVCPSQLRSDGSLAWPSYGTPGTYYFEYNAYDGTTFSNRASVTIQVGTSNDAPLVRDDDVITLPAMPSEPLAPLTNDVPDTGFGPLRASLVGGAQHGQVSLSAENIFTYLPAGGFHGRDSVRYRAIDSAGTSSEGTINIIVDTPPELEEDEYTVIEDGVLDVAAAAGLLGNDSDADGDTLQVVRSSFPTVHVFQLAADGSFHFEPAPDFIGDAEGSVTVTDGLLERTQDFVIHVVTAENHPPRARPNGYSTPGATTLNVAASAGIMVGNYDPDGQPIHAVLRQTTQHGTLVLAPDGSFVYTPPANFQGYDPFVYVASDGVLESAPQTVSILVNTAPLSRGDSITAQEDTDRIIELSTELLANDSDPDQGPLLASMVTLPANGSLTALSGNQWRYRPKANFYGSDRFQYRASDGFAYSVPVEVMIDIAPVDNDPPVAVFDVYQLEEDATLTVSAEFGTLGNDVELDPQELGASLLSSPARGELQLAGDGGFRYTPVPNDNGEVEFSYRASDPTGLTSDATVRLRIRPVNDLPVAFADSYVAVADRLLVVTPVQGLLANDRDVDSPLLEATVITQPHHGRVQSALDGSFSYLPDAGYLGADEFRYQLDDGAGGLASALVHIDVRRPNQPPTALNDSYATGADSVLLVPAAQGLLRNDRDADGDALRAELALAPVHGTADVAADGGFRYQPANGFRGSDSFRYRVVDTSGLASTASVTITVSAANTAPLARDDSYVAASGVALNISALAGVLVNDSDGEGDFLTARVIEAPQHGSLILDYDGAFRYQPQAGFAGTDSFRYVVNDGRLDSAAATVQLQVRGANSVPVATADTYALHRGLVGVIAAGEGVLANDSDANGDTLTAQLVQAPAQGTLELQGDGSFRYTAPEDFSGTAEFRYRSGDGQGWSAPVTVQLLITAAPDAPVGQADRYATRGAAMIDIAAPGVLANDQGWQAIAGTVRLITPPQHGTLTLRPDGSFHYSAGASRDDEVRFVYRIVSPRGPSDDIEVRLSLSLFGDGFDSSSGGSR